MRKYYSGKCMAKSFNMEMNIAKALGIFAIVAGHTRWNIFGDFWASGFWHVPLFFFISGYFFKAELFEVSGVLKKYFAFVKKIVCKYLGRFYAYHFFYGGMTYLIYIWFDRLYGKLPTLKNLTLSPIDTSPFMFSAPNWFLYQLAISIVIFALIIVICRKLNKNIFFPMMVFLPLALLAISLAKPDFKPSFGLTKVIIKTCISMYYIYGGYLYRNYFEKVTKFNIKTMGVVTCLFLMFFLYADGKITLDIHQAKLYHNISHLITPFIGIYFVLFVSKLLAPLVSEKSFIDKVGRNTLHIMANHIFVIFLIELIVLLLEHKGISNLPKSLIGRFYKMEKYKFLYALGSVAICTYVGELLNFTGKQIKNNFEGWKNRKLNYSLKYRTVESK